MTKLPRWGKARGLLAVLVLSGLGLGAYAPSLDNPLLFDDEVLIQGNTGFVWSRAPSLVNRDYFSFFPGQWVSYRPLSTLSYLVNYSLWGEDYVGWRMVYLGWHILNSVMLLLFFSSFASVPAATVAAAFFLLHPIHSEVISQVSFNEEIMMTFFLLAGWLLVVRCSKRNWVWVMGIGLCYALALFCKETALLFPLVIAVWLAVDEVGRSSRRLLLSVLLAVAAFYLAVRLFWLNNPADPRHVVFPPDALTSAVPEMFRLFFSYLKRFVLPYDLSAIYHFAPSGWGDPAALLGLAAAAGLSGITAAGIYSRQGNLAVPGIWFAVGLLPLAANLLVENRTYAFDRYLYFSSIGLVWYGLEGARRLWRKMPSPPPVRYAVAGIMVAVVLGTYVTTVHRRGTVWSDNLHLWEDTVRKAPASPTAHFNLAVSYQEEGRMTEAAGEYLLAIETDPDYGAAYYNLANLYDSLGKAALAEERYLQALQTEPGHQGALLNLGNLFFHRGEYRAAAAWYTRLLEINSDHPLAWNNLGQVRAKQGKQAEAIYCFRRALEIRPDYREADLNLRRVFGMQER